MRIGLIVTLMTTFILSLILLFFTNNYVYIDVNSGSRKIETVTVGRITLKTIIQESELDDKILKYTGDHYYRWELMAISNTYKFLYKRNEDYNIDQVYHENISKLLQEINRLEDRGAETLEITKIITERLKR